MQTLIQICSTTKHLQIAGVATKDRSDFNADFCNLAPLCEIHRIPFIYAQDINAPSVRHFIHSCGSDVIYCFGWSSLIKHDLLESFPIIGYHPASLPSNRGRHPIIWAIALGLTRSASTFFLMDEGADSGAILSQMPFDIEFEDNAQSICDKTESIAQKQIRDFTSLIISHPTLTRDSKNLTPNQDKPYAQILHSLSTPQDHSMANLWRKRGVRDGIIDFRMSAIGIYNLIRALSKPYVGAEVIYDGMHYKIWEAKIVKVNQSNIEPGKVLCADSQGILIKAYDEAILLTQHNFQTLPKEGEYFYP